MKSISLFNLFGEEIYSRNITSIEHNLDLSNLKAGVYFLKINSGKQTKTTKIIKS
ncbi:T9SS type A sorting domain-containing protein [Flavobacterium columnare]